MPNLGLLNEPTQQAPVEQTRSLNGHAGSAAALTAAVGGLTTSKPSPVEAGVGGGVTSGPFYKQSFALVIGMDAYSHLPKLKNAIADSLAVRDALTAHGYKVTHKTNLSSQHLREALEEFFYQTGAVEDAGLLLWFAGHGHTINGEGYLIPVDAPMPDTNEIEFRRRSFSMRNFGSLMREARARHVLAVFDSCFAGTIFKSARSALPPAIDHANRYPVRQFITAGDHTQTVSDNGAFRQAFVDAIMGHDPAADNDRNGYITGEELGIFIKNRILASSGGSQAPENGKLLENDFNRGDFIFKVGAPSTAPGAPLSAAAPMPTASRDPLAHIMSTKVYVAAVSGAPGNGNAALREALTKRLRVKGYEVIDYDNEFAFKIYGTVQRKSVGAFTDELSLRWQIYGVNRQPLGLIEDKSEVVGGARDGQWGSAADQAAGFAADRLPKYLARPS